MPILNAQIAKHIIICNYNIKLGYAGVDNSHYTRQSGVVLLLGDAKETLTKLLEQLK